MYIFRRLVLALLAAQITAGVDNVFNQVYAEHLSKSGSPMAGYLVPLNTRINEPGRSFWVKATVNF